MYSKQRQRLLRRSRQADRLRADRSGPTTPATFQGLILFGPDNMQTIENLFGERVGEQVMATLEARMARLVPGRHRVWRAEHRRLALTPAGRDPTAVSALIGRLQAAIAHHPIETTEGPVAVTLSAGCVITGDSEPERQLWLARHALADAMSAGVGCIRFAEEDAEGATAGDATADPTCGTEREQIVAAAKLAMGALRNRSLLAAYQPVVPAGGTHRAAFHECLARLHDGAGNLVAAGNFMPAMERLGLASLIDREMLIITFDMLSRDPGLRLSLNIFPPTMQDAQWMVLFDEATRHDPSLAERLIIEITETAAMLEPARTLAFMNRLRHRGVAFALDDFGTGHTSFSSLRDFRFDIVKIDGSFIKNVVTCADSRFFVQKLVEIGRHFETMTVAEYVQTAAQARILAELGVEYFQGFYFGAPSLLLGAEPVPEQVSLKSS